jgi:hypothetical protein
MVKNVPRHVITLLASERGHIGNGVASLLGIAGGVLLPIGILADANWLAATGGAILGAGVVVGVNAPHIWVRRVYGRLDRLAPDDPDARPDTTIRIEL